MFLIELPFKDPVNGFIKESNIGDCGDVGASKPSMLAFISG